MLIEEAYEVLDALDSEDPAELKDELGDLLFQVVFHAQISREKKEFDLSDVIDRSYEKMVRRHPHIFANADLKTAEDVLKNWEDIKAAEKGVPSCFASGRRKIPPGRNPVETAGVASGVSNDSEGFPGRFRLGATGRHPPKIKGGNIRASGGACAAGLSKSCR